MTVARKYTRIFLFHKFSPPPSCTMVGGILMRVSPNWQIAEKEKGKKEKVWRIVVARRREKSLIFSKCCCLVACPVSLRERDFPYSWFFFLLFPVDSPSFPRRRKKQKLRLDPFIAIPTWVIAAAPDNKTPEFSRLENEKDFLIWFFLLRNFAASATFLFPSFDSNGDEEKRAFKALRKRYFPIQRSHRRANLHRKGLQRMPDPSWIDTLFIPPLKHQHRLTVG